jgi:hypothetical protein
LSFYFGSCDIAAVGVYIVSDAMLNSNDRIDIDAYVTHVQRHSSVTLLASLQSYIYVHDLLSRVTTL